MQVANLNRKRKKKKVKRNMDEHRDSKDPLRGFDGEVNLDGVAGEEDISTADFFEDDDYEEGPSVKKQKSEARIFTNTRDGTGKSTAGRNAWKEKHSKGQFSGKKRRKDRRYKEPLGI